VEELEITPDTKRIAPKLLSVVKDEINGLSERLTAVTTLRSMIPLYAADVAPYILNLPILALLGCLLSTRESFWFTQDEGEALLKIWAWQCLAETKGTISLPVNLKVLAGKIVNILSGLKDGGALRLCVALISHIVGEYVVKEGTFSRFL
jgi:hypothetical protein